MAAVSSLMSLRGYLKLTNRQSIAATFQALHVRSYAKRICGQAKSRKVVDSVEEALKGLKDGDTVLVGGFGNCGVPEHLLRGVQKQGTKDLCVVTCTAGVDDWGLGLLIKDKLVKRMLTSYVGDHENCLKQYLEGSLAVELTPQGTLVERIRAGGAGIPAFYTPCGVGTLVQEGGMPIRYDPSKLDKNKNEDAIFALSEASNGRAQAEFNGRDYILETAIQGDFALTKAWKADTAGNVIFRKTARNFNPAMLMAGNVGVVEVEELVEVGQLQPDEIHLPGIYVDRILVGDNFEKSIEKRTVRKPSKGSSIPDNPAIAARKRIARRIALEFKDGMYVNLGIGIPCLSVNYIPKGLNVTLQGENGVLGLGPHPTEAEVDPDLINPTKELATAVLGASYITSEDTFAMIRGGHLDITVLGAMQVSQYGDIANWMVPGKLVKGMGGAMDLVSAPDTKVVVAMEHAARDGSHKILPSCQLPLTGKNAVNTIITDLCVFQVHPEQGLTLTELAEGVEIAQVMAATGCEFGVAEDIKPMGQAPDSTH